MAGDGQVSLGNTVVKHTARKLRRLAQGRLDILRAERERRDRGESLEDLVSALPKILAADSTRSSTAQARVGELLAPSPDISWTRGTEHLIDDSTLARLPDLEDGDLELAAAGLTDLEGEMSTRRRGLHAVIDAIDKEIGRRTTAT